MKLKRIEDNPLGKSLTSEQSELIGSLLFLSAAMGPFLFIKSSDYFGRKRTLVFCLLPSLLGYAILYFAERVELYYVARILNGITVGPVCGLLQSYLSEIIFSAKNRGPYLAIGSPYLQIGYLLSYFIGPYVPVVTFNGIIFLITLLVVVLISYACPESPNFILKSKGESKTLNVLEKLEAEEAECKIIQIREDILGETETSILTVFKSKKDWKPFFMATSLLVLQQLSGVNVLTAYSQQIFSKSSEILPSEQCSIVVGMIQVLSAVATIFTSRKVGRKSLLVVSLLGSGFFDLILGLYFFFVEDLTGLNWLPLVGLTLFFLFYNSGLDPIPWVYLGEIFPPHLKSLGSATSVVVFWMTNYILSYAFSKTHVSYLFFTFSLSCFFGVLYVKLKLTETKDKTLREIQKELYN